MKISLKGGEKLQKEVKLENSSEIKDFSEYAENKLAIAKICVLSTAENSHHLEISEEVLRRDIGSIRGNFLVADMILGDATTHTDSEVPVGYFLPNEEIEFEEVETNKGKIVKAWAYAVLSKQYARAAYEMFIKDNHRATSIEMSVILDEEDENKVLSFDAFGSTILGKAVAPSCKDAEISLIRFAEEAQSFFKENACSSPLEQFAKNRKKLMEESKTYKIDKSKEAMSDKEWGSVNKAELRDKIMSAKNRASLVKSVYMLVEDGWEDAPSEHLKYPVMELKGDTFVYNKGGLSSALGYAKKENEAAVVAKINKIYKNLGLDQDGKEADTKMAEIEFAAVDIGDMWGKVWEALHTKYPDGDWGSVYRIDGIYEEDNKKFAIIHHKDDDAKYRLDFSLTEEGLTLAEEIVKVEIEIVETDEVKKFAEPENADKYKKFEDCGCDEGKDDDEDEEDVELSADEMKAEMARLKSEVENRENIIMEKDKKMGEMETELSELREYKAACEKKELATSVEAIMSEVKECMSEDKYKEFRDEGLTCQMSELAGWSNKVKAYCFENGKVGKTAKKNDGVFSFSAPIENIQKPMNVWDRLKNL